MQASPPQFGIGLRREHFDAIFAEQPDVDFLEIISENFMTLGGRPRDVLDRAISHWPVLPHGVGLSIGSPDPLDESYLARLAQLLKRLDPPFFSDHLSYASAFGVQYHDLLPLPFTEEAIRHVVARIDEVQHRIGLPLALENPSYYMKLPGAEMSEAEFISEVVRRSGCYLLLDVNNVWVNAQNHAYDPYRFVDALPRERVVQLHIAGHDDSGELIIDTHGAPVATSVLELYAYTLQRVAPTRTLLEWDNNLPPLARVIAELDKVRLAATRCRQEARHRGAA